MLGLAEPDHIGVDVSGLSQRLIQYQIRILVLLMMYNSAQTRFEFVRR
jgi:hypothetical protein